MNQISQLLEQLNNKHIILGLVIAGIALLLMIFLIISFSSSRHKSKCYKVLEQLRERIVQLKEQDIINNYMAYDHLRNDETLGLLIARWKKNIESLVQEVDAQFSLLDVLEDAIVSRKYKNFYSLSEQVRSDVEALEQRADELSDELSEYIDQASDNRKYIHKYLEMFQELVQHYKTNHETYQQVENSFELIIQVIHSHFELCQEQIEESRFDEADQTASKIFEAINDFDRYLKDVPEIQDMLKNTIEPKFNQFFTYLKYFTNEELMLLDERLIDEIEAYQTLKEQIEDDLLSLNLDTIKEDIIKLENFLDYNNERLNTEHSNKAFIEEQIQFQQEYMEKIEKNARNFIALLSVVQIPYDEEDIQQIETMLPTLDALKNSLQRAEEIYSNRQVTFDVMKKRLEQSRFELEKISKFLDDKVKVVDHIYQDEKVVRKQLKELTEKINGTKKFIKIARLNSFKEDLQTITDLNIELTEVYLLLSEFPIDIVKVNEELERMVNKVEEITKTMNSKLYKAMLVEYLLVYCNRYYHKKDYQLTLKQAHEAFNNADYDEANDIVMELLESIDEKLKREVLDSFQQEFQAIFN